MKSEMDLMNRIEAYLNGELSVEEKNAFELLRRNDAELDHQVVAHHNFMKQLVEFGKRNQLFADMQSIHNQLDIAAIKSEVLPQTVKVKVLWSKHRFNLAIAASVAVLAILSTLLTTGFFSDKATRSDFNALRRAYDRNTATIIKNVKNSTSEKSGPVNPGQFSGTGFALTTNGYIVTNDHVISDADSVYVQNTSGESFKAKKVYSDPAYDIAILLITDDNFTPYNSLPYTIKKSSSDMGESVYTMGFPKDDAVLGIGYLSSKTGYGGDTTAYQVSIDANPGNSGGPLLDNRGNVIGVITGKQTKNDGATFATKSKYLMQVINSIPADSLKDKLTIAKKNSLTNLSRVDQVRKLQDYIFMVKVYN